MSSCRITELTITINENENSKKESLRELQLEKGYFIAISYMSIDLNLADGLVIFIKKRFSGSIISGYLSII